MTFIDLQVMYWNRFNGILKLNSKALTVTNKHYISYCKLNNIDPA